MTKRIVYYADIARMLDVKPASVRHYRYRQDPDVVFPDPVTPPESRTPGWDEDDIVEWIRLRGLRGMGRPPRVTEVGTDHG